MKKTFRRGLCLIAALTLIGSMAVPVVAASLKQITVDYNISLEFNEEKRALYDVNGNEVFPFVYQGTTYVPIRGVSTLFGADIGYDAETKTAVIYDDFSEICGVVHIMSDVLTNCYWVTTEMLHTSEPGELIDHSDQFYTMVDAVETVYDALDIVEDNVNLSIVESKILPYYEDFVDSWKETYRAYEALRNNQNNYTVNTYFDSIEATIEYYYLTKGAITDFYRDYCTWRDLGY